MPVTGAYDSMIASWFAFADQGQAYPDTRFIVGKKAQELRYGENPHQKAALYLPLGPSTPGVAQARQVQGKELSYNNLNDANAALELAAEFRDGPPTVVIVKHANPCGVASGDSLLDAWNAGAGLRQRLGLRRDRRGQPHARRRNGRGDLRHLHRSGGRAGCRRSRDRRLRPQEESCACC